MIGHYILTALRHFCRTPVATVIKVLALALGLVCFLTAHMIGDYFRQADQNWSKSERTVVVVQEMAAAAGEWSSPGMVTSGPQLLTLLREDFPELEVVANLMNLSMRAGVAGKDQIWQAFGADADLLRIFDLDMIHGEASLDQPRSALIEERVAQAAFASENAVGRTITLENGVDVIVRGVFRMPPASSHLNDIGDSGPEILIDAESTGRDGGGVAFGGGGVIAGGGVVALGHTTYAVLPADGSLSIEVFNERLAEFSERRVASGPIALRFRALPVGEITEIQFNSRAGSIFGLSIVTALYLLGAITLAVGCINFANLAAAEASSQAREIGMRRVTGASRFSIASQMLVESGLIVTVALVLVLPLLGMIGRVVAQQFGLELALPGWSRIDYWLGVVGIAVAVSIASGVYPALVLAGLKPATAIRLNGSGGSASRIRTLLIGSQFATAAFLLVLVSVMVTQRANLRYEVSNPDQDPVIAMPVPLSGFAPGSTANPYETLSEQFSLNPGIVGVTFGDAPFGFVAGGLDSTEGLTMELSLSGDPAARKIPSQWGQIYYDYFATSGAEILAGRTFARDRNDEGTVVIDRATSERLGFAPEDAIGQTIYHMAPHYPQPRELSVIGVVDRDPWHLRTDGPTNFFYTFEQWSPAMILRLSRFDVEGALLQARATFERLSPNAQFNPTFLDDAFELRYRSFAMINFAFISLSAIAVAIAAMGLVGMAMFVIQRRLREVGIRKTLGASASRLIGLLLWDFSKPVVIANLIAWPVAFIAANAYLAMFVNRIELTPVPFLAALAATLLVAGVSVANQIIRAACGRPANVLKCE